MEKCIDGAVESFEARGNSRDQIKAVGITNQRETTIVWDRTTGKALHNAIVWTDTRSQELVRRLKRRLGASELPSRCGLPLSTYPSVSKLLWLLENVPDVKDAYERGVLAFGTVDTWLTYKLNGGTERDIYVSDPSNASRTMFMNLETLKYDEEIIDWFRLDPAKITLPRIVRSSDTKAYGSLAGTCLKGTKITGCLGDQSAALVGQKGFTPGLAKNTYGTGCFLLYNVGSKPVMSTHGLLSTVAFDFGEGNTMYALEGSIAVAGSSVKFLVDNFGFIQSSSKLSALAETVEDNGGCTFVTAFSGLFAPYWIDDARGTIFGITAYTQRGHIARATLEATCFQTKAILDSMEKDSGHALTELAVDGGMCNSDLIMQVRTAPAEQGGDEDANKVYRRSLILLVSLSIDQPCGKQRLLAPPSQPVSQWESGRTLMTSRMSTRRAGPSLSPRSLMKKRQLVSRRGRRRSRWPRGGRAKRGGVCSVLVCAFFFLAFFFFCL